MKTATLGFLFRNGKIILAKKKRKIGVGKWNGYGGKKEENETLGECLMREVEGECGIVLEKDKWKDLGFVDFYFNDKAEFNMKVYIYRIDEFNGEPKETEEMGKSEEFDLNKIPYKEMMAGDDKFIPFVLENKKFKGEIHFSDSENKLISYKIVEIGNENSNELKMK